MFGPGTLLVTFCRESVRKSSAPASALAILISVVAGVSADDAALDEANLPKFIQADFIDLAQIGVISKFRSGVGHDFSGGGETCRSMKHYFNPIARYAQAAANRSSGKGALPPPPTPQTEIAIYSPVDGTITSISPERVPIGEQIRIVPKSHPDYVVRLFHIFRDGGVGPGMRVKAGQRIGRISKFSGTDIAVEARSFANPTFVSYFDVMPDSVFAAYQRRGVRSRSDLIFSREFRDAHPFQCNGEQFAENHASDPDSGQEFSLNGWADPRRRAANAPGNAATAAESQSQGAK